MLLALAPLFAQPVGDKPAAEIRIGDATFGIAERISLPNPINFHEPAKIKTDVCRSVEDKQDCGIQSGSASQRILACGGATSPHTDSRAEVFARIPGENAPNLFAEIIALRVGKQHDEGELEIAVLACGSPVAVRNTISSKRSRHPTSIAFLCAFQRERK